MECVEGMEEALLGGVLPAEELDIVDQEHVHLPIAATELIGPPLANRRDVLVRTPRGVRRLQNRGRACSQAKRSKFATRREGLAQLFIYTRVYISPTGDDPGGSDR